MQKWHSVEADVLAALTESARGRGHALTDARRRGRTCTPTDALYVDAGMCWHSTDALVDADVLALTDRAR